MSDPEVRVGPWVAIFNRDFSRKEYQTVIVRSDDAKMTDAGPILIFEYKDGLVVYLVKKDLLDE